MAHNVSPEFLAAVEAAVNDVSYDVSIGWLKSFIDTATFFELDVSQLDGTSFLKGGGGDVTFFDYYTLEPETQNVESWEVTRSGSLIPYGLFMAQADVTLDNTSLRYLPGVDPDIGDSIKPRRPLKISSGFSGEVVPQFVGFTDIPKNSIGDRKTKIHAFDIMDYFDTVESSIKYFQGEYFHDIVEALLLEQGFTADQFILEESTQQPIKYMPTTGMTVGDIFRKGCEAEQAVMFADEEGNIRLWNRFHFYQSSLVATKSISYDNATDVQYQETPIINYMRVIAQPRALSALQKLWQNSSSIEVPAGGTATVTINFEDEFGPLPVTAAHAPVFINAQDEDNRSYYNTNTLGDGTGITNSSVISVDDFGLLGDVAFITFSNSDTAAMFITDLHVYGVPAKVTSIIEEEYKDQQSIDDYGINPGNQGKIIEIKNDWIQNRGTAYALAFSMVEEYKDGNQQLLVKPFADPSITFGDVVEMTVDDVSAVAEDTVVVGTKLSSSVGNILEQQLILDKRTFLPYFTLDVSQLDGADVLAA